VIQKTVAQARQQPPSNSQENMQGLKSRMARLRGSQADPLDADLKKITESGVVEVPQELFALVVESTHDADSRRKIMAHLRGCLSEVATKRWKRVYCGLLLAERLLESGSPVLMIETAHGHHFDLLQKVSFLEHFQCEGDKHSQHLVRKKAADLRNALVQRMTEAADEELPQDAGLAVKDTVSCGTGASSVSTNTGSTAASSSAESTGSGANNDESQPGFWARSIARVRGSGSNPLQQTLSSITESAVIDIPKELLQPVVEASHDKDNRKEIMQHLRGCLTEPSGAKWRRTYAGLVLLEGLVQQGDPAIVFESSQGLHFDLVQQLSFLEQFEYSVDRRAQNLIRRKTTTVQELISQKLEDPPSTEGANKQDDTPEVSTKQQESAVSTAKANSGPRSIEGGNLDIMNDFTPEEPKGQLILNGIVTVGHNDDTTSESSGGEGAAPVRRRDIENRNRKTKSQRDQAPVAHPEALLDFAPPTRTAPPVQANNVDLLDL